MKKGNSCVVPLCGQWECGIGVLLGCLWCILEVNRLYPPDIELHRAKALSVLNFQYFTRICRAGAWIGEGNNWCSPYSPWQKIYENRPYTLLNNLSKAHNIRRPDPRSQIIGAEAALWSEQSDSSSLDTRVWPRASALAERLWSNPDSRWSDAFNRLLYQRERMVARNFNCESVAPPWCLENQGYCKWILNLNI